MLPFLPAVKPGEQPQASALFPQRAGLENGFNGIAEKIGELE